MTKKTKSKKNAAFLKKIGTLSFSVGGKSVSPKCPDCGGHKKVIQMKGYLMTFTQHPRTPEEREENERAFGA